MLIRERFERDRIAGDADSGVASSTSSRMSIGSVTRDESMQARLETAVPLVHRASFVKARTAFCHDDVATAEPLSEASTGFAFALVPSLVGVAFALVQLVSRSRSP